jgi:hypothetical protein
MAFGQPTGPPASAREIARLAGLMEAAGYSSFKEARHPKGLTQRQAAGKFTRDEAAELILRLEAEAEAEAEAESGMEGAEPDEAAEQGPTVTKAAAVSRSGSPAPARIGRRDRDHKMVVAGLPDEIMAAELELRGWTCIPPL